MDVECPYCLKALPDERAACCGEVGHGVLQSSPAGASDEATWNANMLADANATIAKLQAQLSGEPCAEPVKGSKAWHEIQGLRGYNARLRIEMDIIDRLLDGTADDDLTSIDMEYWIPVHDRIRALVRKSSPEPGGDLATVKRLFAAECDDIDRLLERLGLGDKATIAERYRSEGGFLRGGKIENAIRERMSCLGWLIEWRGAPDKKARWATVTKDGSERVIFDDKAGDALRFARADDAYACMMMLWQAQWRGSENAPRLEELSVSEHLWCNGPSPETKTDAHDPEKGAKHGA